MPAPPRSARRRPPAPHIRRLSRSRSPLAIVSAGVALGHRPEAVQVARLVAAAVVPRGSASAARLAGRAQRRPLAKAAPPARQNRRRESHGEEDRARQRDPGDAVAAPRTAFPSASTSTRTSSTAARPSRRASSASTSTPSSRRS